MKNNLRVSSIHHIFCVLLGTLGLCVIEHIGIVLILEACGFFSRLDYFIVALLGSSKSRALYWVHTRILLGFLVQLGFSGHFGTSALGCSLHISFSRVPSKYTEHCSLLRCFG